MTLAKTVTDITDCDREPIHQLGQVQSFGALVAVNSDWIVTQYSENLSEILGKDIGNPRGHRLDEFFDGAAMKELRRVSRDCFENEQVERCFGMRLTAADTTFDVALHSTGKTLVIEFEPHDGTDHNSRIAALGPLITRLPNEQDIVELCNITVAEVRKLIGFDRVMVYKFHEDGTGEVIAEDHKAEVESYFGLRYPKTDIPEQARELYLKNRFRIIADVRDEGVPIVPGITTSGEPLDLSLSILRSVSLVHLEYLRNMGVMASLSISIVVEGKLWGLVACHHYEPAKLSYSERTAAELVSAIISINIERALNAQRAANEIDSFKLHDQLMRGFAAGTSIAESLDEIAPMLERVIDFDGVSVWLDGVYRTYGMAPDKEEFGQIQPILNTLETSTITATESLEQLIPEAQQFADRVVGAIIIPISRSPRDYVILWRRELVRIVSWAGDPSKAKETGDRLTPRKSFAAWQDTVRGRSAPWTRRERDAAVAIRTSLLEVILRVTDEAVQERARSQAQQELLIAELNHRVRNILNLIRSLVSQSRSQAETIDEFSDLIAGRIGALSNAHDNITRQNWTAAAFRDLLASEAEAYLAGKTDRVKICGPRVMIAPEAFTVLALVMHEMITNAAKYGSLCDSRGKLLVNLSIRDNGDLQIDWREEDGPEVTKPKRRGFGSTIIEKSIPFELGGESEVAYKKDGLEATFVIPAAHVTVTDEEVEETLPRSEREPRTETGASEIPDSVLLVEDSMLIALDVQDCLEEAGVARVEVASTVTQALGMLKDHEFQFAILDFNLGSTSSEPVAKALREKGVPFVLATGYGDLDEKLKELGAKKLLTKPYGKQEVTQLLEEWSSY
ncbi:GAF domain-containing protein [Altererythrobacter aurantiacus]|uniref:histidine kinase n=1 Tax=Parapontixanthobacter aurantiacus TaxID=1463599 RepID=A0A844ZEL2_9SPHN|nr:HWE histidine kinase domain-containing protein [Parapontixanthobacter aurantiacus]MXO86961.1 GAF domain-containing protein [Parapontixanthobacter aurantiacus]